MLLQNHLFPVSDASPTREDFYRNKLLLKKFLLLPRSIWCILFRFKLWVHCTIFLLTFSILFTFSSQDSRSERLEGKDVEKVLNDHQTQIGWLTYVQEIKIFADEENLFSKEKDKIRSHERYVTRRVCMFNEVRSRRFREYVFHDSPGGDSRVKVTPAVKLRLE